MATAMTSAVAVRGNYDLDAAVAEVEGRYVAANPESRRRHEAAIEFMPGGNTRSILFYSPFPLGLASGAAQRVTDLDGHTYTDFLGEYSAGLYGHNHPVILAAIRRTLESGIVLGGPNRYEAELAWEIRKRFPSIELVRFCNSGTEANLFAISAARVATGRPAIMVFDGAYHGGVFYFSHGGSPINAPFPWIMSRFNDTEAATRAISENANRLAAVIVEPMQGGAGCIAGDPAFLAALRESCTKHGIVLIFDEVMTSRMSQGGVQARLGIIPDMTTLGKYLGGGLTFGAFGGSARIMERFDPRRPDALPHAGTFNNNVLAMAAGIAGMKEVLTPDTLKALNDRGDRLRQRINTLAEKRGMPLQATGVGSIIGVHFHRGPIRSTADIESGDPTREAVRSQLMKLMHLELVARGQYIARRGYMTLSLPMDDSDVDRFVEAVESVLDANGPAIRRAVDGA